MSNVIHLTDKSFWLEMNTARKQLAWHKKNNKDGIFDKAIETEEELIRSLSQTIASQAA